MRSLSLAVLAMVVLIAVPASATCPTNPTPFNTCKPGNAVDIGEAPGIRCLYGQFAVSGLSITARVYQESNDVDGFQPASTACGGSDPDTQILP